MSGLVMILGSFAIFIASGLAILFFTVQGLMLAGYALNPHRPVRSRRIKGALAALCLAGLLASAAGGYIGIAVVAYFGAGPGGTSAAASGAAGAE